MPNDPCPTTRIQCPVRSLPARSSQVCLEGQISKESVKRSMSRGEAPSGDLIPWTLTQQFQESDFAALSGARVVRVAVHPEMQHMGYGSRAIDQLVHYYQGELTSASKKKGATRADAAAAAAAADSGGLLAEQIAPRAELPPLLLGLGQRPPERLHWLGASFGLTQPLFRFWHRLQFLPVYVRQTVNDTTGEHTAIVLRPLADSDGALPAATRVAWASEYCHDFRTRLTSLLGLSLHTMGVDLALSLLDPELGGGGGGGGASADVAPSSTQLEYLLGPYDLRRLQSYANSLVDHHLVMDMVPLLAKLRFTNRLGTPLSHVQGALLLGLGLQHKTLDELGAELSLPASQLLALFNKAVRRIVGTLKKVVEDAEAATLPHTAADADAAASALRPLQAADGGLDDELGKGAAASLHALQEEQKRKQAEWLDGDSELARYAIKGSDADWDAALGGDGKPQNVSLKRAAGAGDAGKKKKRDGPQSGGKSDKRRKG
jgi:N-acetyltransferase 10